MTHLDDNSDDDSFLYDEEVYNAKSVSATNAGTVLTGSAAATARLEEATWGQGISSLSIGLGKEPAPKASHQIL
jgi:hypothetical protein